MSLIKCPECNKEVSDKAISCIHCGYPINNNICLVNGETYDLSFLLDDKLTYSEKLIQFIQLTNCYFGDSGDAICEIIENKKIPPTLNIKTNEDFNKEREQVHCPKCKCKDIGVVNRGYSMLTGFIGSGKAMNVCRKCGYKWKP